MRKVLLFVLVTIFNPPMFGQSVCDKILKQGVFDYYSLQSEKNFDYVFKKLIVMSKEEIDEQISSRTLDASIPIPFAENFLNLAFSAGDEQEHYKKLKEYYVNNTETSISYSERVWLVSKVANKDIIDAWKSCVSNEELNISIDGDIKKEFTLTIIYKPKNGNSRPTTLSGLTLSNLDKVGDNVFKNGLRIEPFNSYTQKFQRKDDNEALVVINVRNFPEPLKVPFPKLPKPLPVYEIQWFNTDRNGNPYYTYYIPDQVENNHDGDCCAVFRDKEIHLSDLNIKNARIDHVDYRCDGAYCPWCYNQNGAGQGYAGQMLISGDRQSFHWWRKYDGRAVNETYTIFYQKPRGVCVKNCNDMKKLLK